LFLIVIFSLDILLFKISFCLISWSPLAFLLKSTCFWFSF
jgi:hypothetical protein